MNIERIWNGVGTLFSKVKNNFPALSSDEQVKYSWLRLVESLDDLPDVYRSTFEEIVGNRPFPYAVLTPSYVGFMDTGSEKLVFWKDDSFFELDAAAGEVVCTSHSLGNVIWIEEGRALLHSWVKICSIDDHRAPVCTEYKFNTVSEQIFTPIIGYLRSKCGYTIELGNAFESDDLPLEPLKLMNYARRSILSDEKILTMLLQPEIGKKRFRIFGNLFYKTLSLPHVNILTNREMIFIQDGGAGKKDESRYGGVYRYIFLKMIDRMEISMLKDDLLMFSIYLVDGHHLDSLFSLSMKQEIKDFIARFEQIRNV